ncbi:MAG TPA: division plane positioning ATPase MipZ [Caulobacteraceae bacterium]|jgi:chromosome partitioning protein
MSEARVIVVGNEKGGAGKSTIAIHMTTALLHAGARVAVLDLDLRQQSLNRFFDNRRKWLASSGAVLPGPLTPSGEAAEILVRAPAEDQLARFEDVIGQAGELADFIVVDTPGADTPLSRKAHQSADVIITPLNDSFVDFDMLGQVDPVSLDLLKPSLYSESVWEARKVRASVTRRMTDWLVLRNRLAASEARNRKRLEDRIQALSRRVGFRIGPGLRDRVIYRELFPFGLTIADLGPGVRPVAVSLSHVAARQELRALMQAVGLHDDSATDEAQASVEAEAEELDKAS